MKNSGCESERDTDDVLDLRCRDIEVFGYIRKSVSTLKAVDEVLDSRATADDERHPKRTARIYYNLRVAIRGQLNLRSPSVVAVGNSLEVVANNFREVLLPGSDNREHLLVVTALRIVKNDLGAVCVEAFGGQCVLEPNFPFESLDRWTDTLHRHASAAKCCEHVTLRKSDERHRRAAPGARKARHKRWLIVRSRPRVKRGYR